MKCACGFIAQHALQLISSACSLRKQASRKLLQNEQKFLFCTILKGFNVILTFCKLFKRRTTEDIAKDHISQSSLKTNKITAERRISFHCFTKTSVCACLRRLYHHMSRDCWPALNPHNQINLRPVTPVKHDLCFKAMQILGSLSY